MENNNFWSTDRGKATGKFFAWMIFVIILVILFARQNVNESKVTDDNTIKEETKNFENYADMQKELLSSSYEYKYKITNNENTVIYEGALCNGVDSGYKETSEGIIKYKKENNEVRKIVLEEETVIDDLYEGIDSSFINLDSLFTNLEEYLYNVTKNDQTREIKYNKVGYSVLVNTDLEHITKITIINDTASYELEFTNIGKCANISLNK